MSLTFKESCHFTLSANEIRQFSECARKRYYSSRDCLAIRSNRPANALVLGSAFHEALQYYYTELNKLVTETLAYDDTILQYDKVEGLLDSIEPFAIYKDVTNEDGVVTNEPIVRPEDVKTLECMLTNYRPQIIDDLIEYEVIGCESVFNMENWPINDVQYHGLIDMIVKERKSQKIFFFEHKTCTNFRPEIYSRFDIQLHIYAEYGQKTYGDDYGGMILNQVKKAKTEKGYDQSRNVYVYDRNELDQFMIWLTAKTKQLVSPENNHAPCNNYMSCKMCEFVDVCMKYGYNYPKTHEEVTNNEEFNDEYRYDPRQTDEEGGD